VALIVSSDEISGVVVVTPQKYGDERGYFIENYRREWFPQGREMVQGNRGNRISGCIVGLHYHLHQADYWTVPFGHARVVLHDLRQGSPTVGNTQSLDLGEVWGEENNHLGVFIPPGVAHGFASLTDMAITYLVDSYYNPADENGVAWNDPSIKADWGLEDPLLSERDGNNPLSTEIEPMWQPHYGLRP
jgi:dTDP-4-dehydrorhamnose 3,5-epimerase